jgi:hypothetical protein
MVWIDAAEMAADNFAADDPNRILFITGTETSQKSY